MAKLNDLEGSRSFELWPIEGVPLGLSSVPDFAVRSL